MQKLVTTSCRRYALMALLALAMTSGMCPPGSPTVTAAMAGPGQIILK